MYRLINDRINDITEAFSDPTRKGALEEYNWLLEQWRLRNVATDPEYKRRFRGFWRMRCCDEYGQAFFALLERGKTEPDLDPVAVARELYEFPTRAGQKTLEFSFATKLAHTINPHLPIYDSMVSGFYHLSVSGESALEQRLAHCARIHAFLREEYARVLKEGLLGSAIQVFRKALPAASIHTDEKVIDWLIWQFVDLSNRRQWFLNGQCRYS